MRENIQDLRNVPLCVHQRHFCVCRPSNTCHIIARFWSWRDLLRHARRVHTARKGTCTRLCHELHPSVLTFNLELRSRPCQIDAKLVIHGLRPLVLTSHAHACPKHLHASRCSLQGPCESNVLQYMIDMARTSIRIRACMIIHMTSKGIASRKTWMLNGTLSFLCHHHI